MVIAETYQALQTKLVDGAAVPLLTIEALHFYELCTFISLTNHQWICLWTLVNGDKWQSLPPNVQKIVEQNMNAAVAAQRRETPQRELSLLDKLQRSGIAVNTTDPAPFRAKLRAAGYYARAKDQFAPAAWAALAKYADIT